MNKNDSGFPKPPKFIQYFITIFLIVVGVTMLFCAMFTPPHGEIHPSILAAFGMILTFVGTTLGIDYNYKSKLYGILSSHKPRHKPKQS